MGDTAPAVVEDKLAAMQKEILLGYPVKERPKRMNQNMGRNVIVPVKLKNVLLLSPIKDKYPNNYREKRCSFIVGGIKYHLVNTRNGVEVVVVVEIQKPKVRPKIWNFNY